jgi:hypothetical protein
MEITEPMPVVGRPRGFFSSSAIDPPLTFVYKIQTGARLPPCARF